MDKITLKQWFSRGKKPTAAQFASWMDSYWHKGERLPIETIEQLQEALEQKLDTNTLPERMEGKQDKEDNALETDNKTVVGAINEIKEGVEAIAKKQIASTQIDENGCLIIYYSDETFENVGNVVGTDGQQGEQGANGADGRGITQTQVDGNGDLIIYYSDETTENAGHVVGADGKPGTNGTNGQDGSDGRGITGTQIDANGDLILSYSDGATENAGHIGGGGVANIMPNYAGHVTADIAGATLTGSWGTSGSWRQIPLQSATINIAPAPNSIFPVGSDQKLYDTATGRFRENNQSGQVHTWRFTVSYSALASGQTFYLIGRLRNPDSSFEATASQVIYTANNITSGTLVFSFETVADANSLEDGRGYIFEIQAIFNSWQASSVLNLTKILRTSLAMENGTNNVPAPTPNVLTIDDDNKEQYIEWFADDAEQPEFGVWLSIPPEYNIVNIQTNDLIPQEFIDAANEIEAYYEPERLRGIRPKGGGDFDNYQRLIILGTKTTKFWSGNAYFEPYNTAKYIMSRFWYQYKNGDMGLWEDAFSELMFMNGKWWSTYY